MSTLLNVAKSAVVITSVTDVASSSGRHLLQSGGVLVTFTVTSSQSPAALTAAMTNGALTSALAASFANAGLAAPTVVGGVSVSAPVAPTPAPWYAKYNNKKDLGALAILVVLPVAGFGFYWMSPMRKRHFPPRDAKMDEPPRVSYGSAAAAPVYSAEEAPDTAAAV